MSKMKRAAERDDDAGDIRPNDRRQRIAEFVARFERLLKERAELEALQEVGDACRFDLFDWSRAGAKSGAGGSPQSTDQAAPSGFGAPPVTH